MAASPTPSSEDLPSALPENQFSNVTIASHGGGASSRRLPPPCWSHDETAALIDVYRDKWYSVRRGNLRANHWQEVADDIATRCPVDLPKTSMQCRHKMEKLRKRYRAEIQRAASYGGGPSRRYCSTWIHFKRMDEMERGPDAASPAPEEEDMEDDQVDFNQNSFRHAGHTYNQNNRRYNERSSFHGSMNNNGGPGFRIRINSATPIATALPMANPYGKIDGSSRSYRGDKVMKKEKIVVGEETVRKRKGNPLLEAARAIKMMGEGFVRMESMKMDVARELEQKKMEMEMKKTELILESQQKMVEAFAKAFSDSKANRMPTPEW
ncbi:unnamed protein product [Cuscuta epithymum]|uniref:Myb-like domain-containing protein n=1 Tax=Cuscuta epithymum TaxID=186058 RepID=A0AAV0EVU5_9ASTE|nr:unnamed protein product [Cuscuta epithymum]